MKKLVLVYYSLLACHLFASNLQATYYEDYDEEAALQYALHLSKLDQDHEMALQLQQQWDVKEEKKPRSTIVKSTFDQDQELARMLQEDEEIQNYQDLGTLEDDFKYALQLQQEEKAPAKNQKNITPPTFNEDFRLAQQLQQEEDSYVGQYQAYPQMDGQDRTALQKVAQEYKQLCLRYQNTNEDVHKITSTFGRTNYPAVYKIEQKYLKSKTTMPHGDVYKEMLEYLKGDPITPAEKNYLASIFGKINGYFAHPQEAETQANVPQLLSSVWDLSKRIGVLPLATKENLDGRKIAILSLVENIATNGGCYAGVAGRLFRDYQWFTQILLGVNEATVTVKK